MKLNSITAYKVVDLNGKTIADIRTDGKKALVLKDQSNGIIKNMFEAGFVRGKELIEGSATFKLQANIGIGIYYFTLSTGDSLAVTTDDQSAALNGEICDEIEFAKILHLINTKQITASSAGHGSPVSMLYNLADHTPQPKSKFNFDQARLYSDQVSKTQKENDINLDGLNPLDDAMAIAILKTQKAGNVQ